MKNREKFYGNNPHYIALVPTVFASGGPLTGDFKTACIGALIVGCVVMTASFIDLKIWQKKQ